MWLSIYKGFSIQMTNSDYNTCIIVYCSLFMCIACSVLLCSSVAYKPYILIHSMIQTLHPGLALKFLLSSNLYGFSYCLLSMLCYSCVLYCYYTNSRSFACLPTYMFDYICTLYTIFIVIYKLLYPIISLIDLSFATHTLLLCKP